MPRLCNISAHIWEHKDCPGGKTGLGKGCTCLLGGTEGRVDHTLKRHTQSSARQLLGGKQGNTLEVMLHKISLWHVSDSRKKAGGHSSTQAPSWRMWPSMHCRQSVLWGPLQALQLQSHSGRKQKSVQGSPFWGAHPAQGLSSRGLRAVGLYHLWNTLLGSSGNLSSHVSFKSLQTAVSAAIQ